MKRYENLTVIEYDKARNDGVQGGYKYLIKGDFLIGYTAYKTDKGFNNWLQRSNLKLEYDKTSNIYKKEEKITAKIYSAYGVIEEQYFWDMEEIPENANTFKGLSNGSLVDCYYIHTENGSKVYKPNPNAERVYKPMPIKEHLEFQEVNG